MIMGNSTQRSKLNLIPYFGGKFKSLNWLYEYFPKKSEYRCFVDVFGGSGVVVLNHPNKGHGMNEIYNDVNSNVVNLFRVLRDREKAEELAELIALTPFSREEKYDCWEHYKNPELSDVERARMYLVVIKQGVFGRESKSFAVTENPEGGGGWFQPITPIQ
jgi:DNA adenine methylase